MEISKDKARDIAEDFVVALGRRSSPPLQLVITDDRTRETEFGWIFFYTLRELLEPGQSRFGLFGNAPLIVNKFDGSTHLTGTAEPVEAYADRYLAELERRVKRWGLVVTQVPVDPAATVRALRANLGLMPDEARAAVGSIPAIVLKGARVDLETVLVALRAEGFECDLRECASLGGLPN